MRRRAAAFPIAIYDPECRRCARLAHYLDQVHAKHPTYHCRPVAPFGANDALLVIVGLAPGMHGANATGRPFTGDYAGKLLYATLHKFGFASRPRSVSANDGLRLIDARITNAVKCLPPANKPLPSEVRNCNAYLPAELATLPDGKLLGKAWIIGVGMLLTILLPATQDLCRRVNLRPLAWVPAALGVIGLGILVQLGGNESYEFIYFRF